LQVVDSAFDDHHKNRGHYGVGSFFNSHNPFHKLKLRKVAKGNQPCFSPLEIRQIIEASSEPYKTVWTVVAETGMRRGEVCALECGAVDCENCVIVVSKSSWNRSVGSTKANKPRVFAISRQLAEKLKMFVNGMPADAPVFLNRARKPIHPDVLVEWHLTPILKRLGIKRGGAHAFRHGNATLLDSKVKAPMAVRQSRLGHCEAATTMGYTHLLGADDHQAAEAIYKTIFPDETSK